MPAKLFQLTSGNVTGDLTGSMAKVATGTSLKCLLQIAPVVGLEIVEWGVSFDGSAAATPGQVELVEVDVAASGGTAAAVPVSTVATAISSAATTTLVLAAALQGTATQFQIGTAAFGGAAGTGEQMQVTAGGGGTSLTVVRGVNDTTALSSIPIGTLVYGLPGTGINSDIQLFSGAMHADPTYALTCNVGTALTGFGFSTLNSPTRIRQGDAQLLPPTAPYVKQFPVDRGFEIRPGRFGQIRCTFGTTVNAWAYIVFAA